jgi:GT2 family glycosyltransferase
MQFSFTNKICVGVATRERPALLSMLLDSFVQMKLPANTKVIIVIVENASFKSLMPIIGSFSTAVSPIQVIYEHEPSLGIAQARNRVINIAMGLECDSLAFVDDDEVVDPDWLVEIYAAYKKRKLDYVGGPCYLLPPDHDLSLIERLVWNWQEKRLIYKQNIANKLTSNDADDKIVVITSNCMLNLNFLKFHNIYFDSSFGFACGEDTFFFRELKLAGAKTGWAPHARVYEHILRSRLNFAYQFKRGRDHAVGYFVNKRRVNPSFLYPSLPLHFIYRTLSGLLLIFAAPFTSGRSLVAATRSFGFSLGCLYFLFNVKTSHYANVT